MEEEMNRRIEKWCRMNKRKDWKNRVCKEALIEDVERILEEEEECDLEAKEVVREVVKGKGVSRERHDFRIEDY